MKVLTIDIGGTFIKYALMTEEMDHRLQIPRRCQPDRGVSQSPGKEGQMNPFSNERGLVFNIQKFSVHDGPGIRTAVFVKGCPLRCKWCSNPESQSGRIQILWDEKKCVHCQRCVLSCPEYAVTHINMPCSEPGIRPPVQNPGGRILIEDARCSGCGICVRGCPGHALSAEGEYMSAGAVLEKCLQDVPFYEESGGGVTLSGGEILSSPRFAAALTALLHENGIHVALETTGFASPQVFTKVAGQADLLLFDMKHWNEKKHMEGTGVSNLPILANMKRGVEMGLNILPRIPVIPGFNDAIDDARGMAARLHEAGLSEAQLLPFHQFGENKYHMLRKEYAYEDVPSYHPEDLEEYRQSFIDCGIRAFFRKSESLFV